MSTSNSLLTSSKAFWLVAASGMPNSEAVLLEMDCDSLSIWGAGWLWRTQQVTFDALINIKLKQGNRTLELEDPKLRERVSSIVTKLFAGVNP